MSDIDRRSFLKGSVAAGSLAFVQGTRRSVEHLNDRSVLTDFGPLLDR
jgi:hypothetical protein